MLRLVGMEREKVFQKMTRVDYSTFCVILAAFAPKLQQSSARCAARILSPQDRLVLVLNRLAYDDHSPLKNLSFSLPPSTESKYRVEGIALLHEALQTVPQDQMTWPNVAEMQQLSDRVVLRVPELQGVFGVIDGTMISIPRPKDAADQQDYYTSYKMKHCIKCVFVFATDGTIIWETHNLPGSWHDSVCCTHANFYNSFEQCLCGPESGSTASWRTAASQSHPISSQLHPTAACSECPRRLKTSGE